jgi:hypothetical protein
VRIAGAAKALGAEAAERATRTIALEENIVIMLLG